MGEDSISILMKNFCELVVKLFEDNYLIDPKEEYLQRIMEINSARGFPGCICSIGFRSREWNNCPISWARQCKGKDEKAKIVLEVIADGDMQIFNAAFGFSGTFNDTN